MSKKFLKLITEAVEDFEQVGGEGEGEEQSLDSGSVSEFNRKVNQFIVQLKRTKGIYKIDGSSDFASIFDQFKRLYNDPKYRGRAKSIWDRLSAELGIDRKNFNVVDKSENGLMDLRLLEYIKVFIAKLIEPNQTRNEMNELLHTILNLTKRLIISKRNMVKEEVFKTVEDKRVRSYFTNLNDAAINRKMEMIAKSGKV